jgi:hypothetical protein
MPSQIPSYKDAIEILVLGMEALIEHEGESHWFKFWQEGDGWNEPFSDHSSCACGWDGVSWVQTDRQCSGRTQIADHVLLWAQHITEDVWRDEDEGIPQDSNSF